MVGTCFCFRWIWFWTVLLYEYTVSNDLSFHPPILLSQHHFSCLKTLTCIWLHIKSFLETHIHGQNIGFLNKQCWVNYLKTVISYSMHITDEKIIALSITKHPMQHVTLLITLLSLFLFITFFLNKRIVNTFPSCDTCRLSEWRWTKKVQKPNKLGQACMTRVTVNNHTKSHYSSYKTNIQKILFVYWKVNKSWQFVT